MPQKEAQQHFANSSNSIAKRQVEERGRAAGGRAPGEVIFEAKDVIKPTPGTVSADVEESFSPLSKAVISAATPTITYLSLAGQYADQEFAPPDPGALGALDYRVPFGAFYGQTPYSDATWFLTANPITMFLVGLGVGAYESRLRARKKVSDSVDAAKLKEENEKLKGALDELKQYAQQTETPGQMGGGYADRLGRLEVVAEDYARFRVRQERTQDGCPKYLDNDGSPSEQTRKGDDKI